MNIVYYLDTETPLYLKLLEKAIASAIRNIPNVELYLVCKKGMVGAIPRPYVYKHIFEIELERGFYTKNKQRGYYETGIKEGLFIDVDTIINANISLVFNEEFQIAVANRNIFMGKNYPYNSGVVFCKDRTFFKDLYEMPIHKSAMTHEKGFGELVNRKDRKVLVLRSYYNYTPIYEDDPEIKDAYIIHYKGAKKQWMLNRTL